MKSDLHTHSTASDGTLSPQALLARAAANDVEQLALTDHDTVNGVRELQQHLASLKQPCAVKLVPGVEITVLAGNGSAKSMVHVLGLWVDTNSDALEQFLQAQLQVRQQRGEKIAIALEKQGITGAYEGAQQIAAGAVLARPHFARYLVQQEICSNEGQAFRRYLGKGKAGDVACEWPSLVSAIEVIHAGGGLAVLAHPDKYAMTASKLRALLDAFAEGGGDGVEVVSGAQDKPGSAYLARLADKRGLRCSAGSDFHGPEQLWCELGAQPPMPAGCSPIWN